VAVRLKFNAVALAIWIAVSVGLLELAVTALDCYSFAVSLTGHSLVIAGTLRSRAFWVTFSATYRRIVRTVGRFRQSARETRRGRNYQEK
jgi:hypothetical protein